MSANNVSKHNDGVGVVFGHAVVAKQEVLKLINKNYTSELNYMTNY